MIIGWMFGSQLDELIILIIELFDWTKKVYVCDYSLIELWIVVLSVGTG